MTIFKILKSALPPFVVPVGGMHVSGESLPKNMEEFIKDSPEGFIYVSFGSEADLAKSPKYLQQIFFNVMKNSKVKFLWKWGGEMPEEMPENVLSSKWMPHLDIQNAKRVYYPCGIVGNTRSNLSWSANDSFSSLYKPNKIITQKELTELDTRRGIRLELGTLKQSDLEIAINQLLTNPSFRTTMQITSKRFKDRKESPVELAMWWVHYAFRHEDDTSFMRPLGMHQYWFLNKYVLINIASSKKLLITSSK